MGGVDRQFAGQVIDGHHGNVFFSRERGMDVKASGMDVIEGISDRRRPPGGRNRPVNIAGDVGDGANPEVGVAGIFRGEEDRGLRIPEGGAYEQVGMGQKTAEGAPVLRGMVEEVEQVEGAPFLVFVVVARVEADEYRKVAFFSGKVFVRGKGMDAGGIHEFQDASSDPASAGDGNPQGRQFHGGQFRGQFFHVAALPGRFQRPEFVAETPRPETVVGPHHAGKTAEADDPHSAAVGEHFIIDEPDVLADHLTEELPVVRLLFDGVRKEKVGLPGDQFREGYFLNPHQNVALRKIFLHRDAQALVFFIPEAADRGGLYHHLCSGHMVQDMAALLRREGHPFIGRHLTFSDESDSHALFVFNIYRSNLMPCARGKSVL